MDAGGVGVWTGAWAGTVVAAELPLRRRSTPEPLLCAWVLAGVAWVGDMAEPCNVVPEDEARAGVVATELAPPRTE